MPLSLSPLLAALQQPATYAHPAGEVVHLETHISHIFLAGDYAYKLKKPVDFGFLDFTTPEKRRAACAEEVRLNTRLAPDIYLDVVPVYRSEAGYHVRPGGCAPGETEAEVLVHMRRFPQDGLLDHLAMTGQLTPDIMTDIAHQLARFHAAAGRKPESSPRALAREPGKSSIRPGAAARRPAPEYPGAPPRPGPGSR